MGKQGLHYRLTRGHKVTVSLCSKYGFHGEKEDYEFYTSKEHGYDFNFFVVAKARRRQICGRCLRIINPGEKYFGEDQGSHHYNDPKFCVGCAIQTFKEHPLEEFVWDNSRPLEEQAVVLREVNITEVMFK